MRQNWFASGKKKGGREVHAAFSMMKLVLVVYSRTREDDYQVLSTIGMREKCAAVRVCAISSSIFCFFLC